MRTSPAHSKRWYALVVLAAAQFMVIMDTSIIGVALPKIQTDLGFSQDELSWVFNAYVVALGGLLLLGGRLSDLLGARRIFVAGWAVLAAGSLAAGLAGTQVVEIVGRAVQGAGAALIAPSALALLMGIFGSDPKELGKAMAFYGAAAPAGGTAGVFLGGVITQWLSWPWVFLINVPVALVAIILTGRVLPGSAARRGSVDLAGAVSVTAGIALAVYAIVRAPQRGWGSTETVVLLAGAVVVLGAFIGCQRVRREPLMPLAIFRAPGLAAANLGMVLLGAAWIPMWFFLNLYLQQVLGYGAFDGGAALLPMTVTIMIGMVAITPRLITKYGFKRLIASGLFVLGIGLGGFALTRAHGSFAADVLPWSLIAASGMSLAFVPGMMAAMSGAPAEQGGLASGIVNTSYQVGSALGLAAMTALATSNGARHLGHVADLTRGFHAAFIGAAAVAAAGASLAVILLRAPATASNAAGARDARPGSGRSRFYGRSA